MCFVIKSHVCPPIITKPPHAGSRILRTFSFRLNVDMSGITYENDNHIGTMTYVKTRCDINGIKKKMVKNVAHFANAAPRARVHAHKY